MYQCCLEEEQILKKEKQKALEEVWALKATYSKEIENLLKTQVHKKIQLFTLSTNLYLIFNFFQLSQEKQKNELKKLNDQMKNVVNIEEYKILKNDFEVLTAKHREILHLVLFKVYNL